MDNMKFKTYLNESTKSNLICNECGHKFKKSISKSTAEIKCPKCKGVDVEIE